MLSDLNVLIYRSIINVNLAPPAVITLSDSVISFVHIFYDCERLLGWPLAYFRTPRLIPKCAERGDLKRHFRCSGSSGEMMFGESLWRNRVSQS